MLNAFKLSNERRGRVAYVAWLEARAGNDGGKIDQRAMEALRRGWYLGEESFKDKLLDIVEKAGGLLGKKGSLAGDAVRAHHESEAERIIVLLGNELGLPKSFARLRLLKKSDPRKVICAAMVKAQTSVSNEWIVQRLAMGHPASMSQRVHRIRRDVKASKKLLSYEKLLKTKD